MVDAANGASEQNGGLLKNSAYEILRERIVRGTLQPGTRLSERALSTELNMSKTPIKAALERLEEQGFVTLSPQRRATVRAMSGKEVSDLYDLRIALESFVVRQVAGNISEEHIDLLSSNLEAQRRITSRQLDIEEWSRADFEFHLAMTRCLGNDQFERIMSLQRDRLYRLVSTMTRLDSAIAPTSCIEHHTIFEHVRNGRPDQAVEAVVSHLEHGRRFVLHGERYGGQEEGTPSTQLDHAETQTAWTSSSTP